MSGIDFKKPGLRLGYLIRGEYFDEKGAKKALRLCGPRSRVGTLTRPDPDDTGVLPWIPPGRIWEARVHSITIDESLGDLGQAVQAISDLSMLVDLGAHVDELTDPMNEREKELRADAVHGRWANHPVKMWWIDLDSDDFQEVFAGRWDRDPTGIGSTFSIVAGAGVLGMDERLPGTVFPSDESDWTNTTSETPANWRPSTYLLPGFKERKFRGPAVGDATGEADYVWMEIAPYGWRNPPGTRIWFAHVSAVPGLYVHNVAFVDTLGEVVNVNDDIPGALIYTFVNDDPASGPVGTNVRFPGDAPSSTFNPGDVIDRQVWARVSGYGSGDNIETIIGLGAPFRENTTTPIRRVWDVLEGLFEDSRFLGLSGVFGTGAIANFRATAPASPFADWVTGLCALPPAIVATPPLMREVVGGMLLSVGADMVQRWDPVAGELRIYPIWRGPRPGQQADHEIDETWALDRSADAVLHLDDPDGDYANAVEVTSPEFFAAPIGDPDHMIDVESAHGSLVVDPTEQAVAGFGGVRRGEVEWPLWLHHGTTGFNDAARYFGAERSQKQRILEATLNHDGLAIQLGEVVKYSIPGVYAGGGHVRGRRIDPEAMTVRLRSYHQVFHEETEKGKDDD